MKTKNIQFFLLLLAITFTKAIQAQCNLVPNGNFETYINGCPPDASGAVDRLSYHIPPWTNDNAHLPIGTSADYYNCTGYVGVPSNWMGTQTSTPGGSGYIGAYPTEMVGVPLSCALSPNQRYDLKMYVSLGENTERACNGWGMHLSNSSTFPTLPITPTLSTPSVIMDYTTWTLIQKNNYIANGTESYLFVGTFGESFYTEQLSTSPTAFYYSPYYYIDNISITPVPATITATKTTIASGECVTLTASGCNNYSWSTGSAGNSITVCPLVTTTYYVTTTLPCCSPVTQAITIVVVQPACNITVPPANVIPNSQTVSSVFGAATSVAVQNYSITGTFTVNHNFEFISCSVIMNSNSKIIVQNGSTLTLSAGTHQVPTHLFTCTGNMWNGIEVQAGGSVVIKNGSMIEDALCAVKIVQGASASITSGIFNRNLTGVEFTSNTSATSPVTIQSSIFTCRTNLGVSANYNSETLWNSLSTYAPAILKAPYNDRKGCYGINATDVNNLAIGVPGMYTANGFDAIMCGIYLTRSNSTIYNNRFQDLLGSPNPNGCPAGPPGSPPPPCYFESGYGIRGVGTAGTGTNSITIGNTGSYQPNTFNNIFQAISVSAYKVHSIVGNTIANASTGPFPTGVFNNGKGGIAVYPTQNNNIDIRQNTVNNCETGILVNRYDASSVISASVNVSLNTVNANSSGYCKNAIYISDMINNNVTNPGPLTIQTNTIFDVENCINLLNVKKTGTVTDNLCTVKYVSSGTRSGIYTVNCNSLSITLNHLRSNVSITGSANLTVYGMYFQNSPSMSVKCNLVENVGSGMVFSGACNSSTSLGAGIGIMQNTMRRTRYGLVLQNSGVIGQQGDAAVPSNNYWDVTQFYEYQTWTDGTSNPLNSKLYVTNTTAGAQATRPTINQGTTPYTWGTSLFASSGTLPACGPVRKLISGILTENNNSSVKVYPNPFTEEFTAIYDGKGEVTVTVIDLMGKALITHQGNATEEIKINMHDMPAGFYLVKITAEGNTVIKKIIKQ